VTRPEVVGRDKSSSLRGTTVAVGGMRRPDRTRPVAGDPVRSKMSRRFR